MQNLNSFVIGQLLTRHPIHTENMIVVPHNKIKHMYMSTRTSIYVQDVSWKSDYPIVSISVAVAVAATDQREVHAYA